MHGAPTTPTLRHRSTHPDTEPPRSRRAWLAWSIWAVCLGLTVSALVLLLLMLDDELPASQRLGPVDAVGQVALLAFPTIGALIAARRPEHRIGWLFLAVGAVWSVYVFADALALYAGLANPGALPGVTVSGWLANWLATLALYTTAIFLLLLFPSGQLMSAGWRWIAWLAVAGIVGSSAYWALQPGPLSDYDFITNPVGIAALEPVLSLVGVVGNILVLLMVLAAAISAVLRFGRAQGVERAQMKWFAFAAALVGLAFIIAVSLSRLTALASFWVGLIVVAALITIPVATGIAILRYRLYDIDLIINRAVVYTVLSISLLVSYWVSVVLLQRVFQPLAGGSGISITASTLVVAGLFHPVRTRVQSQVDRRFYRRKYDAAQTIDAFSARLRSEIELTALVEELRGVVQETMQPAHVSLWLKGTSGEARSGDQSMASLLSR